MSAPPPDLMAFHLGFVVHDVDAVMDCYRRMLGVEAWRMHELSRSPAPWSTGYSDARLKVAFGRGAGITFELIQVLEGRTQHSEFLEAHGEGIQHIGFWSPNIRTSVETALSEGARLVNANLDPEDRAVVQLTPGSSSEQIMRSLENARLAYVDPGFGTVQIELVGPSTGLREWLQQDFDRIIVPPPWET